MLKFKNFNFIILLIFNSSVIFANTQEYFQQDLITLQTEWAKGNYLLEKSQKIEFFKELFYRSSEILKKFPKRAEMHIWHGIISSTLAAEKGGISALGLAKLSKARLETAIKLDPNALNGAAYTSLGVLYDKVPGWPIGFGNDQKANKFLKTAIKIDPEGIDSNYFYGQYLIDHGHVKEGVRHLTTALNAPPRLGREVADQGRRAEIQELLAKVH